MAHEPVELKREISRDGRSAAAAVAESIASRGSRAHRHRHEPGRRADHRQVDAAPHAHRNSTSRTPKIRCAAKFADALAFQSRVLGELQKSVMKIRMVPVEQLFRRFPRVVRDVAKLRSKDIALEIAGRHTDLDKGILDALAEPLAHLVRNAVDHGIESPRNAKRRESPRAARFA